ncbi:hypothetical protein [Pseudoxanthomonas sp. JBR18]|uniref:hypothetical protein n=1 Tax=Pseudoxanthomonas sp. JBR18 TaxID=2969308 RepID=UPI0023063C10|nr:hypothetical protein [Pseudoxanthomonas sp. JBR18]WCE02547.1 hypothetical protein PJ250_10285 [Pseudoxanthomonas sp. JBR18]
MITKPRTAITLALLSLLAVICSSNAATKSTAFPIGRYQSDNTIVIFNADGTFLGTTPKGEDWVKGTYTHKGNTATVTDIWEGDAIKEDCTGKVGKYTWTKSGKVLTFHVVEDACEGRKHGTDGVAWTQIN